MVFGVLLLNVSTAYVVNLSANYASYVVRLLRSKCRHWLCCYTRGLLDGRGLNWVCGTGFNCGEAANFATPGWLNVAREASVRRAAMNYLPMLSHQQLLYMLATSITSRSISDNDWEGRYIITSFLMPRMSVLSMCLQVASFLQCEGVAVFSFTIAIG